MTKGLPDDGQGFALYTDRYPDDIYGYYWGAQANASIDTDMTDSLAILFYYEVVETGEKNKETNRWMLLKACRNLEGYKWIAEKQ